MTNAAHGAPHPRTSWHSSHFLVLGCLAVLGLGVGWAERERELLVLGDEAVYVALSHSLAEGRYHDEYLVGTPPHVHYPPGMPAWLLGLRLLGGGDPEVARAVNLLLVVATVLLVADLVRRISTPWTGVVAGSLTALNPLILDRAGTLYAETLFMVLATLAIWAAQRFREDGRRRWVVLSLVAGLGGFLTRVAGIAVLAGTWGAWLLRRAWRVALATGLATAVIAGGWFAYATTAATGSIARSYGDDLAARVQRIPEAQRVLNNARIYLVQELPAALQVPTIAGTPVDNLLVLLVLGTLGGIGLALVVRRAPAMGLTLLAYGALLGYWVWPNARFVTPILPLIAGMLAVGAHGLGSRLGRLAPVPMLVLLGITAAPMLGRHATLLAQRARCDVARAGNPAACHHPEHQGYVAAAWFIRDHLPADALVIGENPAMIHYLSGRRAIPGRLVPRSAVAADLDPLLALGATHVLLGPARREDSRASLARATLAGCARFTTVAAFPGALLLGLRAPGAPGADACADLTAYLAGIGRLPSGNSPSPDAAP